MHYVILPKAWSLTWITLVACSVDVDFNLATSDEFPLDPKLEDISGPMMELSTSKREWNKNLHGWGKRAWQNMNGGWGKRESSYRPLNHYENIVRPNLQDTAEKMMSLDYPITIKEGESRPYTKFNENSDDGTKLDGEQEMYSEFDVMKGEEAKRVWNGLNTGWGKRSDNWGNFRGSWGKKDPVWNNFKGMWGKRSHPTRIVH